MTETTEDLKAKRDELNSEVKKLLEELKAERDRLNSLNERITELKEKRDSKNKLVSDLIKKKKEIIELLKASRTEIREGKLEFQKLGDDEDIPKNINQLKSAIKKLDWDIQTRQHTIKRDEQMRERLEKMETVLKKAKDHESIEKKIGKTKDNISQLEDELELTQQLIVDNQHASNLEHEELIELYKKIKEIRESKSPQFKKLKELKKEADDAHKAYIDTIRTEREKKEEKIKEEKKRIESEKKTKEDDLKEQAKKLFTEFAKGKKLTSEELRIIQKYGE